MSVVACPGVEMTCSSAEEQYQLCLEVVLGTLRAERVQRGRVVPSCMYDATLIGTVGSLFGVSAAGASDAVKRMYLAVNGSKVRGFSGLSLDPRYALGNGECGTELLLSTEFAEGLGSRGV